MAYPSEGTLKFHKKPKVARQKPNKTEQVESFFLFALKLSLAASALLVVRLECLLYLAHNMAQVFSRRISTKNGGLHRLLRFSINRRLKSGCTEKTIGIKL